MAITGTNNNSNKRPVTKKSPWKLYNHQIHPNYPCCSFVQLCAVVCHRPACWVYSQPQSSSNYLHYFNESEILKQLVSISSDYWEKHLQKNSSHIARAVTAVIKLLTVFFTRGLSRCFVKLKNTATFASVN